MARALRRGNGTASLGSRRNPGVWDSTSHDGAVGVDFRSFPDYVDLRRPIHRRMEPPEGARKAHAGQYAGGGAATNRDRLEPHGADLLVYAPEHKSGV